MFVTYNRLDSELYFSSHLQKVFDYCTVVIERFYISPGSEARIQVLFFTLSLVLVPTSNQVSTFKESASEMPLILLLLS